MPFRLGSGNWSLGKNPQPESQHPSMWRHCGVISLRTHEILAHWRQCCCRPQNDEAVVRIFGADLVLYEEDCRGESGVGRKLEVECEVSEESVSVSE
jgi:hypothetical protein